MLPTQHKLSNSESFRKVIRKGSHSGRSTVVVHLWVPNELVTTGGPRCGLVVSKAIGNAVMRHKVSRQLRHLFAHNIDLLPDGAWVVIRALPPIASASPKDLERDVTAALAKAAAKWEAKGTSRGNARNREHAARHEDSSLDS